ncbi:MAG: FitA-like ribbon-helix-helix domain-containing protein [Euzebya sp.]
MAQLIVRNLEAPIVQALKKRAAARGRSAEEEHRAILREALMGDPDMTLGQALTAMPDIGEDNDFARQADVVRPVDL